MLNGSVVNGDSNGSVAGKDESYSRPNFLSDAVRGREIDGSEHTISAYTGGS